MTTYCYEQSCMTSYCLKLEIPNSCISTTLYIYSIVYTKCIIVVYSIIIDLLGNSNRNIQRREYRNNSNCIILCCCCCPCGICYWLVFGVDTIIHHFM